MKGFILGVVLAVSGIGMAGAQAPAGAPAGATGICKDGTYSTAASKSGACGGHKGVQTWYAAAAAGKAGSAMPAATPAPASTMQSKPAPTAAPSASAMPAPKASAAKSGPAAAAAAKTAAPGGGPGLVWVNTDSNVYHCPGTDYYGKTKQGAYMTEAAAKAKGARGARGATCDKK
jgi:hypothetical protein